MAGNRVEELEAKVRELEATIDGLTDELVETKERLQTLEAETGVEADVLEGRRGHSADPEPREDPAEEPAAGDGEASADDVNSDEAEGEDNVDSESGDDIIVA